jgi:hypothetical protein
MNLVTFRIIGNPAFPNASWVKVGKGLNVIKAFDAEQARSLFTMLQAINPPYDFKKIDPFRDLPLYTLAHKQTRKIIPAKKTAAIAIFTAPLQLVKELANIDPVFFETDRIECGRRRDQSRWINFVELSSSTRWSEIESIVRSLLSSVGPDAVSAVERLQKTTATLRSSDRIKGKIAVELRGQLEELRQFLLENKQVELDHCLHAVDRAQHFQQAKDVAEKHLPLFLTITRSMLDYPIQTADVASTMETSRTLFDSLIKRQEKGVHANAVALKQRLHQINLSLQTIDSGLAPHFREEGISIILEGSQKGFVLPFIEMLPVCRIEVLLSALAAMHKELYGLDPIFLIDIDEMKLEMQELVDLYRFLLHHSSQWQFLVIPDSSFLALCSNTLSDDKNDKHHLVSILDLEEVV